MLGLPALDVEPEDESLLYDRPRPTLTGLVRGTASPAAAEAGTAPPANVAEGRLRWPRILTVSVAGLPEDPSLKPDVRAVSTSDRLSRCSEPSLGGTPGGSGEVG